MAAAAFAATAPHGREEGGSLSTPAPEAVGAQERASKDGSGSGGRESPSDRDSRERTVSAPVRIADGATVRLLRPGDRVDVIATEGSSDTDARVVARRARVTDVPTAEGPAVQGAGKSGGLVVLRVPSRTATKLAGASATAQLAVTLC
ncbi:RcpC/CpaB family pilus assembly protein [Streptomyces oceani]|uniref:RcpC/CpaB family pilus assembly protein n=1 Tax=Streptomyces oceani TaxID=1075402 RepID=UPI001FCD387B|nr:RcpC/CpaB family pilus assembly protein [Streptomyces oceani]